MFISKQFIVFGKQLFIVNGWKSKEKSLRISFYLKTRQENSDNIICVAYAEISVVQIHDKKIYW